MLGPYFLTFDNYLFWKSLDYLTLICEMGVLIGILIPRIFRYLLLVTVGFHTANLLLLNIDFSFNFAFYALFLPWRRIGRWLDGAAGSERLTQTILTQRNFIIVSLLYLIFFALTESSIVIFALNLVGIDYLGNAVVRTFTGLAIVVWLIADFVNSHRVRKKAVERKSS